LRAVSPGLETQIVMRDPADARYRPDVDGLRAYAVLAVVLFHFGFPGFGGGFVGVDVFFVISGFLITRLIVDEVRETGRFGFGNFYLRRARRLAPAMLATFTACFGLAFLLFSPADFERFAGSLVYALLSLSNFYFWQEAGYFDAAAATKPLLHTWSLAVEEQFYLLWPALLVFLLRRLRDRWVIAAIGAISLLSLAAAQHLLAVDPPAAFYLLPARGIELAIGALMVWAVRLPPRDARLLEPILVVGLVMIAAAIVLFTPETPFPGVASLLPCLGAALVIYAGTARYAGLALRNRASVALGRASYSIYLVHWPLLVFYAAYTFTEPSRTAALGLVAASIVLGGLQYRLVEQRYRFGKRPGSFSAPAFGLGCALAALVLMLPAATVWATGGAAWRIPADRAALLAAEETPQHSDFCGVPDVALPPDLITCQIDRGARDDLFVWGDSHANHLTAGLAEAFPAHNIYIAFSTGCVPQNGFLDYIRQHATEKATEVCLDHNRRFLDLIKSRRKSTVIITSAKRNTPQEVAPAINFILGEVQAAGHEVIYLADFIRPARVLAACLTVPSYLISDGFNRRRCVGDRQVAKTELAYNAALSRLVSPFVDVGDIQCPKGRCIFTRNGRPLFRDDHHLSTEGAIHFLGELRKSGRLAVIAGPPDDGERTKKPAVD
jgi:peptidoglycan/LPS O-acetylase OafA/YrhL